MSTKRDSVFTTSHALNLMDIVEEQIEKAFLNEVQHIGSGRRFKGTGKHKRSPYQNGASATACLLIFIVFESGLRFRFYNNLDKKRAHSEKIWSVYSFGFDNADEYKKYFDELELVRDIVAHGYVFEGNMSWNEKRELVAIEEKAISGKRKNQVIRQTEHLGLHTSPNQMSFMDAAKFYVAFVFLLKELGMDEPYDLWMPPEGFDWDDLEPIKWLKEAVDVLGYSQDKGWKLLMDKLQVIEDKELNEWAQGITFELDPEEGDHVTTEKS